jgi:hypothetical protein
MSICLVRYVLHSCIKFFVADQEPGLYGNYYEVLGTMGRLFKSFWPDYNTRILRILRLILLHDRHKQEYF